MRRGRPAALHRLSARADRQPLSRPVRADPGGHAGQPGRFDCARSRSLSRALPRRWRPRRRAVLEPGDAIYLPFHWWHGVESLEPVNAFVNYWWNPAPAHLGSPYDALLAALTSLRGLPDDQRAVWRSLFDHYVFGANGDPAAHLPPDVKGILGPDHAGAGGLDTRDADPKFQPAIAGRLRDLLAPASHAEMPDRLDRQTWPGLSKVDGKAGWCGLSTDAASRARCRRAGGSSGPSRPCRAHRYNRRYRPGATARWS